MKLSIVTVSMNRTSHLVRCAEAVSDIADHYEHLILDFGSSLPIKRDLLPSDERIRLLRVDSPTGRWWLTHAYNLAFALSYGEYILKLDADILLSRNYIEKLLEKQKITKANLLCNRLTLQDWSLPSNMFTSNGLFLCKKERLAHLKGFNPYIQGWGWDDIDLYSRFFLAGFSVSRLPQDGLELINHGNDLREPPLCLIDETSNLVEKKLLRSVSSTSRMLAQNHKNKQVALASIEKGVQWPSLEEYSKSYWNTSRLPFLPKINLFSTEARRNLAFGLVTLLLGPSRMNHLHWRILQHFGVGPYVPATMQALLDACNVDLSLVS